MSNKGTCKFCGETYSKRGIVRHMRACDARKEHNEKLRKKPKSIEGPTLHLKIEHEYMAVYWLHVEIAGSANLHTLDHFLRDIWVECCGHMSAFTIDGTFHTARPSLMGMGKGFDTSLAEVLDTGATFSYEYDFGTTTRLTLKVVDKYEGVVPGDELFVMARNEPYKFECMVCGDEADEICTICMWENDEATLCQAHAETHEHEIEMMLPIVNSPRVGMCGYAG